VLSTNRQGERLTVRLIGSLEGSSAEDLRLAACPPSALDVDLSGVTSIDSDGERVLVWLRERGATLCGDRRFVRRLCRSFAYSNQLEMIAVNDVGRNRDELRGSQYEGEDDASSALPN
jgi:hypothetical protein